MFKTLSSLSFSGSDGGGGFSSWGLVGRQMVDVRDLSSLSLSLPTNPFPPSVHIFVKV